jgi:hypothetical protein
VADVYVLASPAPTLYVYPSTVHPATTVSGGPSLAPVYAPARTPRVMRDKGSRRYRLTILGAARVTRSARLDLAVAATATTGSTRARGELRASTTQTVRPQGMRVAMRTQTRVAATVRSTDHRRLSLSPVVFDLLLDDWETP